MPLLIFLFRCRLFWFVCICASWYGCFLVISSSLEAFQNNALSFGTDTTYINWNTSLFAVSICEDNNMDRVFDIAEELVIFYIEIFCFWIHGLVVNSYSRKREGGWRV